MRSLARKQPVALVAEDDPMQAKAICYGLRRLGIASEVASSSKEFIARLKDLAPDLCLVDLNMDSLGIGFKVIEAVRRVLGPDPVLIIVSAVADRAAIAHGMEIGANDYIVKPVDLMVLGSKLSRYVRTDELEVEERKLLPLPDKASAQATVIAELEIASIDEFGIKLHGRHLLSKGTMIQLDGDFVREVTGREKLLLSVSSTWTEIVPGVFGAQTEFDPDDVELITRVRKWLTAGEASVKAAG